MRLPSHMSASRHRGLRSLAVLLLCAVAALAQAQSADDDSGAPPDRVARLSVVAGDLGILPAGAQDWASADLNRPLTTGDRLSTGDGARAELELGGASLRMAGDTDFGMLNLDDNLAQVELTQGTLNLSVRQLAQGQRYEIDTPTLALVVEQPGTFRIDVDNGGNGTRVTVFNGQATVYGQGNAQRDVFAGRSYQFDDASLASFSISDYGMGDAFDAWCNQRDQRYVQSDATRYVSPEVVGYQDLDQYGDWQDSSEYGAVWYPSQVPAGWAPYRDGHWAWIAPWGWTWVDATPWGFAPYHYGRWVFIGSHWGWIPGPRVVRPVYAPALVAFVGGNGWSVSVGIGGAPVGWFPLGPGEVYNPWYHCDRDYYRRVNVTNIYVRNTTYRTTVINHIDNQYNFYREGRTPRDLHYLNRDAPHGFTAMSGANFASGRRVQRDMLHVDPRQLVAAPVLAHGVTMLRPAPHAAPASRNPRLRELPTSDFRRSVVARTPPPATHAGFSPADARAPARVSAPFNNVRVLDNRVAPRRDMPEPAAPRAMPSPRAANDLPNVRRIEAAPAGELPSARFAHPRNDSLPVVQPIRRAPPAEAQPQPEQRRIASPQPWRPQEDGRNLRQADALPQQPRIERAPQRFQPAEQRNVPAYAPPREPAYAPQRPEPQRFEQAPQRFQPAEQRNVPAYAPPREPAYAPQRPEPQRFEQPRPSYQLPPQRREPMRPAEHPQKREEAPRKAPPQANDQH
ncbi:MAG: hypothetical protein RSP_04240 [Rhodanobacter sp.]